MILILIVLLIYRHQSSINAIDINTISNLAIYVIKTAKSERSNIIKDSYWSSPLSIKLWKILQIKRTLLLYTFDIDIGEFSIDIHTDGCSYGATGKLNVACIIRSGNSFLNIGTYNIANAVGYDFNKILLCSCEFCSKIYWNTKLLFFDMSTTVNTLNFISKLLVHISYIVLSFRLLTCFWNNMSELYGVVKTFS